MTEEEREQGKGDRTENMYLHWFRHHFWSDELGLVVVSQLIESQISSVVGMQRFTKCGANSGVNSLRALEN